MSSSLTNLTLVQRTTYRAGRAAGVRSTPMTMLPTPGDRPIPRRRGRGLPVPLVLLAVLAGPGHCRPAVAGHGGVVELNRATAGPYMLSVWTQPSPPAVGDWCVDVAVIGEMGAPVADATVRVRADPLPP